MITLTVVTCIVAICMTVVTSMLFMGAMGELQDGQWGELLISVCVLAGSIFLMFMILGAFSEALAIANY